MRHMIATLFLFICASIAAQQPSIDLEGTLISQGGRVVLRVDGDLYSFRFPSSTMAKFAQDALGEQVHVKGTLGLRSDSSGQRAVITPDNIDRLGTGESSVASGPRLPPLRQTIPASAETREPIAKQETPPFRPRRRGLAGRPDNHHRYTGYDGSEVYLAPGGAVIIRNR